MLRSSCSGSVRATAASSVIGAPVASLYADASPYNPAVASTSGTVYEVFMRAKVCDSDVAAGGVETNCVAYGTNWKPEGLIQKYANKIRYSAFGYLNDSNILRDGAILRAKQKFVGPTQPVPGSTPIANAAPGVEPDAPVSSFATRTAPMPRPPMPCSGRASRTAAS